MGRTQSETVSIEAEVVWVSDWEETLGQTQTSLSGLGFYISRLTGECLGISRRRIHELLCLA